MLVQPWRAFPSYKTIIYKPLWDPHCACIFMNFSDTNYVCRTSITYHELLENASCIGRTSTRLHDPLWNANSRMYKVTSLHEWLLYFNTQKNLYHSMIIRHLQDPNSIHRPLLDADCICLMSTSIYKLLWDDKTMLAKTLSALTSYWVVLSTIVGTPLVLPRC